MKFLFLFVFLLCAACAKKLPYQQVLKDDDTLSKKQFLLGSKPQNTSSLKNAFGNQIATTQLSQHEWLYVPSTVKAARRNTSFLPFMLGHEKVVRFQFTRNYLQVLEVESDPRFTDNLTNQRPVLSIPVEHIEYQCARNAYNECTSSEEESSNLSWNKKTYFKMKAAELALQEINFLPESWENLFAPCLQQTGARLVDYRIVDGALNFQVEKYFRASLVCNFNAVRELTDLLNLSFAARLHYSFVRMDKLATSNYTPMKKKPLPFGVFETKHNRLAMDQRDLLTGQQRLLNRWHPGREVKLFFSPEFEKPEHKILKEASLKAVQSVNKALEAAQTSTRLSLKSAPADLQIGDARYSTLVLEEEAPAYNVVGYGPSAVNPRTGEIVYARVVMYLGVLKKMVHHAYDELVHRQKASAVPHTTPPMRPSFRHVFYSQGHDRTTGHPHHQVERGVDGPPAGWQHGPHIMQQFDDLSAGLQKNMLAARPLEHSVGVRSSTSGLSTSGPSTSGGLHSALRAARHPRLQSLSFDDELALLLADKNYEAARAVFMRKHNMYSLAAMPIEAVARRTALSLQGKKLLGTLAQDSKTKELKAWRDLTNSERSQVMKKVLPFLWEPILLHELGHILGLRHNFSASEDKPNFYTPKEYAQEIESPVVDVRPPRSVKKEAASGGDKNADGAKKPAPAPAFSSVMDYSGSEIDTLRRMGKYDIATLMYLYSQQVELASGQRVKMAQLKGRHRIKDYLFCTDEHVALNPNCNPFDSGTSLNEIVTNAVHDYDDSYTKINYRNGRRVFSRLDEPSYLARRDFIFRRLRLVLERFEYLQNNYSISPHDWQRYPVLIDLKQALVTAARFYVGVLIKPDVMCAISTIGQKEIVNIMPLRAVSQEALHCFDNVNPTAWYQPVAQGGAFFQPQSIASADGSMAEIDIQGVWMDKLLAWRYLFGRKLNIPPMDHFSDGFTQVTSLQPVLKKLLEDVMLDQVVAPVQMHFIDGRIDVIKVRHQMFRLNPSTQTASAEAHVVPEALHPGVRWFFGLPDESVFFQPLLLKQLHSYAPSKLHPWSGRKLQHSLSVLSRLQGRNAKAYIHLTVNEQPYYVSPTSELARKMAFRLLVVRRLSSYEPMELQKILDRHRSLPKPPENKEPDAGAPEDGTPEEGDAPEAGTPEAGAPSSGAQEGVSSNTASSKGTSDDDTPDANAVVADEKLAALQARMTAPDEPKPGPSIDPLFTQPIDNLGLKVITPEEVYEYLARALHTPAYYEFMLEEMARHTE